ncbi:fungal-specific transcription factor domain-containing protein [Massariosphaeria phaeospora]|uniref:Fungal-specific transcription factor domain-containing protein n=1 Tax=Massariosphaeria phaeospora TaxID=100035 RepID=A0A7C8I4Z7_9PLEO|nr:fungal-specific transcription factor domain-containing protein [Massariosphaeria phaeospora]
MHNLLKVLRDFVSAEHKRDIDAVLGRVDPRDTGSAGLSQTHRHDESDDAGSDTDTSSHEFHGLDVLEEDLLRNEQSRATGFVGRSSEIKLLQRLKLQTESLGAASRSEDFHGLSSDGAGAGPSPIGSTQSRPQQDYHSAPVTISTSTFYLDCTKVEVNHNVDPWELPDFETAMKLLDCYMDNVHDSFPILPKTFIVGELHRHYAARQQNPILPVSSDWLAVLNLTFAIAAKYSHLTKASWRAKDEQDHFIYRSRAQILGVDAQPFLPHPPDLPQIQMTALLAFYFMTIGHINRAWVVLGSSIRFAYALGLHVRNLDRGVSEVKKETQVRLWWGLHSLEGILSMIIGRPSFVHQDYHSAPFPSPLPVEEPERRQSQVQESHGVPVMNRHPETIPTISRSSTIASYLRSRAQIGLISQRAMNTVYSAGIVQRSWRYIQRSIETLDADLGAWSASISPELNFLYGDNGLRRERLILEMQHISTKILITRPCLCKLDDRVPGFGVAPDEFINQTARSCVEAAISLTQILPNPINATYLYQMGPWWSLTHNLMQALTILLLEVSHSTITIVDRGEEALSAIKRLIRWLREMKTTDQIAERAYTMAFGILQRLADPVKSNISDLLREDAAIFTSSETPMTDYDSTLDQYAQQNLFPIDGYQQQFLGQTQQPEPFYPVHPGHESTFSFSDQPVPVPGPYSTTFFGPSFSTPHDEQNYFSSNEVSRILEDFNTDFPEQ